MKILTVFNFLKINYEILEHKVISMIKEAKKLTVK